MIELLSPAGDKERLKFACLYGADAIYIGGKSFGLRANATNFELDEMNECIEYAHSLNKKVYVTVNIVFHDKELDGLKEYLESLANIHVDAIIASDPLVLRTVRENNINLDLHLSTQNSVLNSRACKYYIDKFNVSRIVLAREASKEDIERIKDETNIELEGFIQGAMCTSFSGRCVISNYVTNRDSNRGGCAQICRWTFDNFDNSNKFEMMSKDLNMIKELASMVESGINSFKIEGRMRSIYYIATVLHMYRNIFNRIESKSLSHEYVEYATKVINRVANRDSLSQFYNGIPDSNGQYFNGRKEESNQDFLGLVLDYNDGYITLEVRNYFKLNDRVCIFGPNMDDKEFVITNIINEDGAMLEVCNHPREIVKIKCPFEVEKYSMMHVKLFDFLEEV